MTSSKELYLAERRQKIVSLAQQEGRVSVADLSRKLSVSEVTIRADLQALAKRNLLIRTHGGAIPARGDSYELALTMRQRRQVAEKNRIGQAAAGLVTHGDAIFLDSSSTSLAMIPHLQQHRQLTIITNSLVAAQEIGGASGVRVVMPGGTVQLDTASLIGLEGLDMLRKYNIQTGFFSAHGLTLLEGLTDVSADEAEVKQALVAMCRQTIALLDATKWGQVGLASFAQPEEIKHIITDKHAPADLVEQIRQLGVEVVLV